MNLKARDVASRHLPILHPNSRHTLSVAKFSFRTLTQTLAKSVDVTQSKFGYRITGFAQVSLKCFLLLQNLVALVEPQVFIHGN